MGDSHKKGLWLIRTHYRMRMVSLALVFIASCFQISGKGFGALAWGYMVVLLLLYPHVQYLCARRSKQPIAFAMRSLLLDSVLLGTYCTYIEFSDWLCFSVILGTLSNNAANRGWKSIGSTLLALFVGALIGVGVGGLHFSPATVWPATLICIVGLIGYLLAVGNYTYTRNAQLRHTREELKTREVELLQANQKLQETLVEIESLRNGLAEQAIRDPLTDLFNRRYLDSTLEREIARCVREGKPLALIMVDIDHFKKFNDHYGHLAGDECLKSVSRALQSSAKRASDLAARYGGEEFSLVLPDTDAVQARRMAEELRSAIQRLGIAHDGSSNGVVTVSIGLAVSTHLERASAERLIRAADEALYYAKWGGRNRVQAAPEVAADASPVGSVPEDMEELVWLQAYESGHAEIDVQHAQLFAQVNQVCTAIREQHPRSEVATLVDNLMRHVAEHFECEERVLAAIGFPGLQEHAKLHQHLMDKAVDLIGRYRNTNLPIGDLLNYLAHDLIAKHVLGADRKAQLEAGHIGH
jgi:diguanylate cyclase (GGDEF)-like protein/hemerythrin-like metal-binding protein